MTIRFRTTLLVVLALGIGLSAAGTAVGTDAILPRDVLGQLKAGNDRFARNASQPVSLSFNRRDELTRGQHPMAMVLSCADSRVPPEHVFNVGLGDLFVIRTAGQVVDRSILATAEYGAEHLGIPLLVVMGHESCGAVKAAIEDKGTPHDPHGPNLDYLIKAIQAARSQVPPQTAKERDEVKELVLANVEQVINDVFMRSQILRHAVDGGTLQVVGAYYELASGRVTFSEPIAYLGEPTKPGRH